MALCATSHGKNACDGVSGTVKREAAKASLQATTTVHILTPKDLYQWADTHIKNVTFSFISKREVAIHTDQQRTGLFQPSFVVQEQIVHSFQGSM